MAPVITGILAHVDAGKTTLSEALLYTGGAIRTMGRVDSKNSFLDNNRVERDRGITVFAKQAQLNDHITLIDTPGHVDFLAEIQRSLCVLDAAILLINAGDGIQSTTRTLWSLLQSYKIPVIIFVNKMDMAGTDRSQLLTRLKETFSPYIIDYTDIPAGSLASSDPDFLEEIASSNETLLETFLDTGNLTDNDIKSAISSRSVFPCIFGSALKMQGIDTLLSLLDTAIVPRQYPSYFGAIAYKISKDRQGNRLTHLKVLGGTLHVKDALDEEKANEIRIYSGEKFQSVKEAAAGSVCTVTGLKNSYAGKTWGNTSVLAKETGPKAEPALVYTVHYPSEVSDSSMLHLLQELEEEIPELAVSYTEATKQFQVKLMGQIQTEILTQLVKERYGIDISFGEGKIAYRETIASPVMGVGHYEPLRHYAEVHLKLSPLPRGSGMQFESNLSVDVLDTNWQRLIMTHLQEKQHAGVLTGSPITDIKIEVAAGAAHLKHTEGGDFRQSTYRAIRHGLMQAENLLLEPFYEYDITVPENCTGRVMADMQKMAGTCELTENRGGFATMTGRVSVKEAQNYMNEVRAFTKGQGSLSFTPAGYDLCHNADEVLKEFAYNPDADLENPASSVFCSHGAGFTVPWQEVRNYQHIKD
ncbi:MAG: TetM/TetW/TetO/TetS family tetracycline resistance ribosomal protection protein [Treponemataceae bacterium]|nr:TetM/TetW/TetO/TetS family tetracycline resistance ribosomal protection protein [Treponemataceae bacterium]